MSKGMFNCYYCKENLPVDVAKKGTVTGRGTGKCKPCHSSYTSQREIRKKVENRPQDFFQCDDCDRYMNVHINGNYGQFHSKGLIEKCKFCGSENIDDVV